MSRTNDGTREKVDLPGFISPSDFSYRDYAQALEASNRALHRRTSLLLETKLRGVDPHFAILTTGSDARFEKGPYHSSRIEFIVLEEDDFSPRELIRTVQGIANAEPQVYEGLDIRELTSSSMSFFANDRSRVFPTRILDSVLLYGNEKLHESAVRKLFDEFVGKDGRRISRKVRDQARQFCRIVKNGGSQVYRGEPIVHYAIGENEAVAFYNPSRSMLSFKSGPLRAVQYTLAHGIILAYRSASEDERVETMEKMLGMPSNIWRRLYHLQGEGMLNLTPTETKDLANAYKFFVWAYNLSQEAYQDINKSMICFDKKDASSALEAVNRLVVNRKDSLVRL